MIYEVNGQQISDYVQEGDVFYFRNGAEPGSNLEDHEPAIRISRATYGARGHYVDVTNRIRQLARDRQPFTVSNETFGIDPFPGQQKLLKISYLSGSSLAPGSTQKVPWSILAGSATAFSRRPLHACGVR